MLFVGGPNARTTSPKWRTAAILKNRKIAIHISATVRTVFTKFVTMTHLDCLYHMNHKNVEFGEAVDSPRVVLAGMTGVFF